MYMIGSPLVTDFSPVRGREAFPSDEKLNLMNRFFEGQSKYRSLPDHAAVIGAYMGANYTNAYRVDDRINIATIISSLVAWPEGDENHVYDTPQGLEKYMESNVTKVYQRTLEMMKNILEQLPGYFRVQAIYMDKNLAIDWATGLMSTNMQSRKDAVWNIQYTWDTPFKIETDLLPAQLVQAHLNDIWVNVWGSTQMHAVIDLVREKFPGFDKNMPKDDKGNFILDDNYYHQVIKTMLYHGLIIIEQHRYAKGKYKISFHKQDLVQQSPYFATALVDHRNVVECGTYKVRPKYSSYDIGGSIFMDYYGEYISPSYMFKSLI